MSFGEIGAAQKMRDYIRMMVETYVNKLRPADQPGTILNIEKSGAAFPVGDGSQDQYPPESAGNPANLYYAQVRLDNGEIVTARVAQDIPVSRAASWFDPEEADSEDSGSDEYWLIADGVYRRKTTVTLTDPDTGATITQVAPEMLLPKEPPYVPPRVMISGQAGRYVISHIIRGMVAHEDFVSTTPREVAVDSRGGTRIHTQTITYVGEGWVNNSAYYGNGSYEAEITYGNYFAKFKFDVTHLQVADQDKWYYVEPYQENPGSLLSGTPANQARHLLRVYVASSGAVFFYVASRNMVEWALAEPGNEYTGSLLIRHFGSDFARFPDVALPGDPLVDNANNCLNLTPNVPAVDAGVINIALIPSSGNRISSHVDRMQTGLAFLGARRVSADPLDSSVYTLWWTNRIMMMANRQIHTQDGFFQLDMPAAGTLVPVLGARSTDVVLRDSYTVSTSGVPIPAWCTLYYAPPYGSSAVTPGKLYLVDYNAWFEVPDHWIMIARRNTDPTGAAFTLGNGMELDNWKVLNTGSALSRLSTYPSYYKKENGLVSLRGAFVNNTAGALANPTSSGDPVFSQGFRPPIRWPVSGLGINGSALYNVRVDIGDTGWIACYYSIPAGGQIFLSGITFPSEN